MTKTLKHDKYVESLCKELEHRYDILLTNVPIESKRKRLVAEIDIIGFKDNFCDIFEVKCSHRITPVRIKTAWFMGKTIKKSWVCRVIILPDMQMTSQLCFPKDYL